MFWFIIFLILWTTPTMWTLFPYYLKHSNNFSISFLSRNNLNWSPLDKKRFGEVGSLVTFIDKVNLQGLLHIKKFCWLELNFYLGWKKNSITQLQNCKTVLLKPPNYTKYSNKRLMYTMMYITSWWLHIVPGRHPDEYKNLNNIDLLSKRI